VTLNDLERRNGRVCILRYFAEFGSFSAYYVMIENTSTRSASEM